MFLRMTGEAGPKEELRFLVKACGGAAGGAWLGCWFLKPLGNPQGEGAAGKAFEAFWSSHW